MKTAHVYIYAEREESHMIRIVEAMPIVGSEYLNTHTVVIAVEKVSAYIDSFSDERISNGTVYRVLAEHDDGRRFEELILVPADMTMTIDEFVTNLMDNDREDIDHMTEEQAADILRWMRSDDDRNEIPADLTAAEFAARWNELK